MLTRNNDPRLLQFLALVLLACAAASTVGIARFTIGNTITGALETNIANVVTVAGFFSWYFALMYVFAEPGRARLLQVAIPGLILGPVLYFAVLRPLHPLANQNLLLFGTFGCSLGIPSLGRMLWDRYFGGAAGDYRRKLDAILFTTLGLLLLTFTPVALLDIVSSLHPLTYDAYAYHFESTLGFQASIVLGQWAQSLPWVKLLLSTAYNVLPLSFGALVGAQIARPDRPTVNVLGAFIVSSIIAIIGFHLLPVSGPKFLLDGYPSSALPVDQIPLVATSIEPDYVRNAIPSMHFGWALILWLAARPLGNRWLNAFFSIQLFLNVVATMALGEHYLIDLVVAVPVIVAVQAIIMGNLSWNDPVRRRAAMGGIVLWLAWVIALRIGIPVFEAVPGLSWLTIAATLAASLWLYRPLIHAFEGTAVLRADIPTRSAALSLNVFAPDVRVVAAMFVISGFAGLMYEVVFSKSLALTFGSTATAMYTVLATYMGGMAIGAWLGGRLAAGHKFPLVLYAFCELGIGIYCAATALVFGGIQIAYVHLAGGVAPDAPILTVLRVGLGIAGLMLPTVLMGMTLPILARFLEQRRYALGRSVAILYTANTVGAALGALLVGYMVIPALGVRGTTMGAVVLSLLVAFLAMRLHKRNASPDANQTASREPEAGALPEAASQAAPKSVARAGVVALAILGIGGAITLALETIYIHLLAVVAGNSTYAFSLMLFTFLIGLGAGAEVARRLLRGRWPLIGLLAWLEFGLAIVILGGVFFWDAMPGYFASFVGYPLVREFAAREVVRGIVCWIAMFPPAFFIGAIYPIAMECVGQARPGRTIQTLGYAAALNTVGNIVGVLAGGFVLLPLLGALRTVQMLGVVCIALGILALAISPRARRWTAWAPAAAAMLLLAIQPTSFDYDSLASGANVYFAPQNHGTVIDHAESVDGGLTSVSRIERPGRPPLHTLLTNGKFQGNDEYEGEMRAQLGFSLAPLLHASRRDSALVIGFGTGVSARTLHEAGFRQVDVVELSADVLRLANRHFSGVNADVTRQPGVRTYITDGRNFLLLQDTKYDLIGLEISSIWFAGAASLYNREFYALVRQRLNPGGVLQQWVQLHHASREDLMRVLGSVRAEFRFVWLYLIGGQGIIVASNDANASPEPENLRRLRETATLRPILDVFGNDPAVLREMQLLDPNGIDRLLTSFPVPAQYWVSTDNNLFLEYSTPKGNVLDGKRSFDDNFGFIKRHSRPPN